MNGGGIGWESYELIQYIKLSEASEQSEREQICYVFNQREHVAI